MAASIFDLQYYFIIFILWIVSCFFFISFFFKKSANVNVRLPPSPPVLPLIRDLYLLSSVPLFKFLQKLSSKYGPFLYLRFFNTPIFIVSSASVAYDVYRTYDVNFASRSPYAIENSLVFGSEGFVTAPYGEYWRFMKKLAMGELLGPRNLERSRGVRGEELERFYRNLLDKANRNEVISVRQEMMKLANNSTCRMLMGRRCSEETGEAEKIRGLVTKSLGMSKKLFVENMLNSLRKFGISLFEREILDISRQFDDLLEKILREHEENPNKDSKDIMDILLEVYHDENAEYKISRNHIKSFVVELFIGGTDTSAQTTQWTMAELINNPNILKKLREEIDSVVGKTRLIQETDLPNLPYLQATVKEGLRLHPPGPLFPRRCSEECKVAGFDIPQNATVVINSYAIMRDPSSWEDPNEFRPERFLLSPKGLQVSKEEAVKYLAFGSGRRACPGANLANIFMGMAIGTMVQWFDWKTDVEKINMDETGGVTLSMAHPFNCIPVVRFHHLPSTT